MKKALYTVYVFSKLNTRRFFRDRLSIFFGILFPLIFLFVFGGISSRDSGASFKVAILDQAQSMSADSPDGRVVNYLHHNAVLKVNDAVTTTAQAQDKLNKNQLDAVIIIPSDFNAAIDSNNPHIQVKYTQNNSQTGAVVTSVVQGSVDAYNRSQGTAPRTNPHAVTVQGVASNQKSLRSFDYTFAGLLGFSIIGLGIFGPVNVFPELKKQGILRRLHTTTLRVWQYFVATMISQAIIGLVSLAVMFAVAMLAFHLKVVGNPLEILVFIVFSVITILGIGLAIGGWSRNERQAAPLSNIVVFPMMFLSGTFFPRYAMPEWLQHISDYLPLTPVIDGLRLIITQGYHLSQIGTQLGLMAVWTVIIYLIAFRLFRWE